MWSHPSFKLVGRQILALFAALVATCAWPTVAAATGSVPQPGWYAMLGGPLAWSTRSGAVVGAEVSVVCLARCVGRPMAQQWVGGYVDAVRDFGADVTRFSLGPELGHSMVGMDTGGVLSVRESGTRWGWQARALLTAGGAGLYARGIYLSGEGVTGEFGVLWKIFHKL